LSAECKELTVIIAHIFLIEDGWHFHCLTIISSDRALLNFALDFSISSASGYRKLGLEPESEMVTTEMMRTIAVESWGDEESVDEFTNLYRDVRYGGRKDEEPERKTAKGLFKTLKGLADSKKNE
ncbi:MAG: hypothetical protein II327_03455, partial [Lachnospiraceae bacterium]|nr:hypothetical protein [Lachnospiraceae bacterium]